MRVISYEHKPGGTGGSPPDTSSPPGMGSPPDTSFPPCTSSPPGMGSPSGAHPSAVKPMFNNKN